MRRRFRRNIIAATLIFGAAGCTTPHHSNALIFGTNTSFGIDVGQSATGVPAIVVGYRRQEAVFMPLVANVRYDANGTPTACAVYPGIHYDATGSLVVNNRASPQIPPCFLVGQNGGSLDSYSVLASFGAEFSASATNPTASGGLAQFFATGIAAQLLAIRGGPALVAVGEAAEATGATDTSAAIAALYNSPEVLRRIGEIRTTGMSAHTAVLAYLRDHTTDANFAQEVQLLETAANGGGVISYFLCDGLTRQECLDAVGSPAGLRGIMTNSGNWETAIEQRKQARGIQ